MSSSGLSTRPVPKQKLVDKVLEDNDYYHEHAILIGDSINDYEAAKVNKVKFFGYNNCSLFGKGEGYITSFKEVPFGRV
ncbi:MAG: HAD hydrolase-like protein [Balneolaceae bacterium]